MADDPIKPTAGDTPKPAPRRRAPRKAPPAGAAATRVRKTVAKVEAAAEGAVAEPVAVVKDKAAKVVRAAKPRPARRSPTTAEASPPRSMVARATERVGGKWSAAAIVGGLAAAGAAAAALTLRSSTPRRPDAPPPADATPNAGHAHQPDGTDSSASFEAGIADEGTIPEA